MSEQKEIEYEKGEALNTAEKFHKWISQGLPYYFVGNEHPTTKEEGETYYLYGSLTFQAIPRPESKIKKLYAYHNGSGMIVFSPSDNLQDREPEFDISYPEDKKKLKYTHILCKCEGRKKIISMIGKPDLCFHCEKIIIR